MSSLASPPPPVADYPAQVSRNLVAARAAAGLTQHQLAQRSRVSRATIAQLEAAASDPRLSTLVLLAAALRVSPLFLLLGRNEFRSLDRLMSDEEVIARFRPLEHLRASDVADAARDLTRSDAARVGAAVGSPLWPGRGAAVGATLAYLIEESERPTAHAATPA